MENQSNATDDLLEELHFELSVEKIKNDKLRKEWRKKKDIYEHEISTLKNLNSQKSQVLDKLESEL